MRSLGKKRVATIKLQDGRFRDTIVEDRVVYSKADGSFHINYLSGYREVTDMGDGSFARTENIRTVAKQRA